MGAQQFADDFFLGQHHLLQLRDACITRFELLLKLALDFPEAILQLQHQLRPAVVRREELPPLRGKPQHQPVAQQVTQLADESAANVGADILRLLSCFLA